MPKIKDSTQEIFSGMPVNIGLPEIEIDMYASHEEWEGITDADIVAPSVYKLEMGEPTATHVDALNHLTRQNRG